jgi:sugar lactone lactonase YvrE
MRIRLKVISVNWMVSKRGTLARVGPGVEVRLGRAFSKSAANYLLFVAATASTLLCQTTTSSVGAGQESASRATTGAPLAIFGPGVLAVDVYGNTFVAVRDGIFEIDANGTPVRVAGTERNWHYSGDGGQALQAGLNPRGLTADSEGNIYIADTGNNRIRKWTVSTGVIITVAGDGLKGFSGDGGPATSARLDGPTGVAVDSRGNLYIADGSGDGKNRIRKVAAITGVITTVAGTGSQGFSGDGGPATLAQFSSLGGLATDLSGDLYIADNFNNRVRMVSAATGIINTVAGSGIAGFSGDGTPAINATLNNPLAVAIDSAGDLFIADSGNYRIRKVTLAAGTIITAGDDGIVYRDTHHGYPCAIAIDAAGNLHVADSGVSRIRTVSAASARRSLSEAEAAAIPMVQSQGSSTGFKINVTYNANVPAAAQTAFNSLISTYESVFTSNITVNVDVNFGNTGLGESETQQQGVSYTAWRTAMSNNATANPGNSYSVAGAASLPASDPIGNGSILLTTANARALGFTANTSVDTTLTFSNAITFEYNGVAASGQADFLDVAAHELDEGLGIGSALTGLANNAAIPSGDYSAEDYFRYSASGVRAITTSPNAVVYFSYNGGSTNVAQFNQAYSAEGDSDLDRNDWVYGNNGCPSTTVYVQDAIACLGQSVAIGSGPEIVVLNTLGYDSSVAQTITFRALSNVTLGVAPFSISATASSGLPVTFTSTTTPVCTVSGSTVTILATGTCSITATQGGNGSYAAATPVTQSFVVSAANGVVATAGVNPASGSALTHTFTFSFTDSAGFADLAVVDILINSYLDGRQACYVAFSPTGASSGSLYLVDDAGDGNYASGSPVMLPSSNNLQNSQCTLNGAGSSVSASGNTLTLTLQVTFASAFAGDKIFYMAARSNTQNSGWQAMGTWNVPGTASSGPGVSGVSPARSSGSGQTYAFTFTDTNGYADLSVLDILTNTSLNGASACYVAYVPTGVTTGYLYLIDNAGDGGYVTGSPMLLSSGGTLQNSQCTISTTGASASASGNTLTLSLPISFSSNFAGNQIFYLAARNNSTGNSGWQAAGSVTVP